MQPICNFGNYPQRLHTSFGKTSGRLFSNGVPHSNTFMKQLTADAIWIFSLHSKKSINTAQLPSQMYPPLAPHTPCTINQHWQQITLQSFSNGLHLSLGGCAFH